MKTLSCRFLQRAIYFAPDEIRHCCKRFFYDDEMRGDVRIFPMNSNRDFSLGKVLAEKKDLIDKINRGVKTDCFGCPELEFYEWLDVKDEKFDLISIEHHSRCNMKCSYCSEVYYGGKVANYDLLSCLEELVDNDKIRNDLQVAWGGGEPTMTKNFAEVINFVNSKLKPHKQRFFSNAIIYSEEIASLLHSNKASLTTSVDAGTAETFEKVRGVKQKQYEKVLKNLKKYFDVSPNNVVIKYIFTEENSSFEEISKFSADISQVGLSKANFLISCNYKDELLTMDRGVLIMYLQYLLARQGAKTSVLDEHVRPRICEITLDIIDEKTSHVYPQVIITLIQNIRDLKKQVSKIIVWGIGGYANLLLDKSATFRDSDVKMFVDSNPNKQGTIFRNLVVKVPREVVNHEEPILIASSFWYHDILEQLTKLGVKRNRILPSYLI